MRFLLMIGFITAIAACSDSRKDGNAQVADKKAKLQKLRDEYAKQSAEIKKLEDELALIDTASGSSARVKLVALTPANVQEFKHFIDLQGKVDAENISYISPRGMGGQVRAVYVKEGQPVKKGQLLLKLDDAIMQQQVVAARQQLQGIKTQLAYAKTIYDRQNNLWQQGIGTEVQLITAKTNVESLENQLKAANEQVQVAVEQAKTANVYSDVNGIADLVNIRVGETFTGMTATGPQIKIVNTSSLKVVSSIPENYISRLSKGTPVEVLIPDLNKTIKSTLSLVSQSIDPSLRGFIAEAKIPYDAQLKPNQTAILKVMDYSSPKAVVIPVNSVQSDESGKYVFVAQTTSNGKTVAKKVPVNIGDAYGSMVEVKTGLSGGEQIVTEGYQDLYEGQTISDKVK